MPSRAQVEGPELAGYTSSPVRRCPIAAHLPEQRSMVSNNSPLPLIVTLTSFGCISPKFKGTRNFLCVYQIMALTHLTPFYQMQRPFREKKHSALSNPFSVEVSFHVSA